MAVHFMVLTLNTTARRRFTTDNLKHLPASTEVYPSISGFDKQATVRALVASGLQYHLYTYCGFARFGTYGSLACFLTKYSALLSQIRRRIPLMAMLEDDMRLSRNFVPFVEAQARLHMSAHDPTADILVLGPWGEGYVTSYGSARRIVQRIKAQGHAHDSLALSSLFVSLPSPALCGP